VVPILGAGVNLCDRPEDFKWQGSEEKYLLSGLELARELAHKFEYLEAARVCTAPVEICVRRQPGLDLARISEYADLTQGTGELYEKFHFLFAREFPPTKVHEFLAGLPSATPDPKRPENCILLIVATNYDDVMERALASVRSCDVLFYDPDEKPSRFWHRKPDGTTVKIVDPTTYDYSFFDERPVVLKIHGTIDRSNQGREGYVITEDHYIEYLAEEALEKLLPKDFLIKLRNNHRFFLGYRLRDWSLRVFLRRLKRNPKQAHKAWAVLPYADAVEEQFWQRQEVGIIKGNSQNLHRQPGEGTRRPQRKFGCGARRRQQQCKLPSNAEVWQCLENVPTKASCRTVRRTPDTSVGVTGSAALFRRRSALPD
jgi:hypothetical protein